VKRGDFGSEAKRRLDDRRCGYIGCLDQSMDVKAIQQWYMKQEHTAFVKGKNIREYENFKNIVSAFMKEINELSDKPTIYYSRQFEELVYADQNQEIAISKLSAGYQSLLWMVMDLAYRVCLLNPEFNDRLEIQGIVLIDEICMHLHPKWQWNIINALRATFPGVQFIITTHSPIVISSAKEANLVFLDDKKKVKYLPECYGFAVEDILQFRQESVSRPKNIQNRVDELDEALDDDDFESAGRILAKLKEILGEENQEYKYWAGKLKDAKLVWECQE
jgi:predicted ATP-binding protein involved in virulence